LIVLAWAYFHLLLFVGDCAEFLSQGIAYQGTNSPLTHIVVDSELFQCFNYFILFFRRHYGFPAESRGITKSIY
jgi:hypothetical protein